MSKDDERAYPNKLSKYKAGSKALLELDDDRLIGDYASLITSSAHRLHGEVVNAYSDDNIVDFSDHSVYTGVAGVALLHMKKGDTQAALSLLQPALQRLELNYKDCTFLCGDCGPLAVAAMAYNKMGPSFISNRNQCIERILHIEQHVCESRSLPNEMLYGRAGYLYTLLVLQKELGEQTVNKQTIINVASSIVRSGVELSRRLQSQCPLIFSWFDEYYTGAAHGFAGILYILLKVSQSIVSSGLAHPDLAQCPLTFTWHDKHYFGAAHGFAGIIYILLKVSQKYPEINMDHVLVPTINFMAGLRFPSGNYPSSLESGERDKLVHWCHGAPGFIYMFVAAYEKYRDEQYKKAALDCAALIWKRGLLRKGYGICHGVSGNAYAFLSVYKLTGDEKYLHMAVQFALWCCQGDHGCRIPDRPYSLFEGMAGVCYFLYDILKPKQAKFPAFEL